MFLLARNPPRFGGGVCHLACLLADSLANVRPARRRLRSVVPVALWRAEDDARLAGPLSCSGGTAFPRLCLSSAPGPPQVLSRWLLDASNRASAVRRALS